MAALLLTSGGLLKYVSSMRTKKSGELPRFIDNHLILTGLIARPLPPGPKGRLIIGSLLELPAEEQWLKITEWAQEYGLYQISGLDQSNLHFEQVKYSMYPLSANLLST